MYSNFTPAIHTVELDHLPTGKLISTGIDSIRNYIVSYVNYGSIGTSSMPSPSHISLTKSSRNPKNPIPRRSNNLGRRTTATAASLLRLSQHRPYLCHSRAPSRKHAVLHAVQVATVNRRNEATRDKAEYDARGEVMFAKAMTKLEVLVEHCPEREGNGLDVLVCKMIG